jgi:hypothetical protein
MSDPSNPPVVTPPTTPPLMNDPASRSPDGTIKDQSSTTTSTEAPPDATAKPDGTKPPELGADGKPKPADAATGAPEKYEAFTAPEGHTIDAAAIEAATPIFKDLNLTQAQSQRLVDFYNERMIAASKAPAEAVETMREGWRNEVKADKDIGGKLPEVKATIGKALDALGDPALTASFKAAMDLTGAGDHPAFVKAFYKMAQVFNEGTHVPGGGPSPHGQAKNGAANRPSPAQAMYPNLPSSSQS